MISNDPSFHVSEVSPTKVLLGYLGPLRLSLSLFFRVAELPVLSDPLAKTGAIIASAEVSSC